jgi:hypothetical protein
VWIVTSTARDQSQSWSCCGWKIIEGDSKGSSVFGFGIRLPGLEFFSSLGISSRTHEIGFDNVVQGSTGASMIFSGLGGNKILQEIVSQWFPETNIRRGTMLAGVQVAGVQIVQILVRAKKLEVVVPIQ